MGNSNGDVFGLMVGQASGFGQAVKLWCKKSLPEPLKFAAVVLGIVFAVSLITGLLMWMYASAYWLDLCSQIR